MFMKNLWRKAVFFAPIFLTLCFALGFFGEGVRAATYTVISNADSGRGTLREAVTFAESGDTIVFSQRVSEIFLRSGEILIDKSLIIQGRGANLLRINGNGGSRIFRIGAAAQKVTLADLTLERGRTTDRGGAIFNEGNLLLRRSVVQKSFAMHGGAIYSNGRISVEDSTIYANDAQFGGGISVAAAADQARFTNTTFSGNTAISDDGGGLTARSRLLYVNHCTIVNNTANASDAAGGLQFLGAHAFVSNSIIADNHGFEFNDVLGTINSQGFNLIGSSSGNNGQWDVTDLFSVDPLLSSLQYNNGGTTPTHAPLAGSPAIDAGDESNMTALDQTGASRLSGVNTDIGAVELQRNVQTITVNNSNDSGTGSLREAIADSQPGDIIDLAVEDISLSSPITINKDLIIRGESLNTLIYAMNTGASWSPYIFISAGNKVRISGLTFFNFGVSNHGNLFLTNISFRGDQSSNVGFHSKVSSYSGTVTINNSLVSESFYGQGSIAIHGGRLIVNNSSVERNLIGYFYGGGIYFNGSVGKIKNSAISGNTLTFISPTYGGGVSVQNGFLTLINTTVAGNRTPSGGNGSGIYVRQGAFAFLNNCTVTGNWDYLYPAIYSHNNVFLKNTIVAFNGNINGHSDVGGNIISYGHNLIGHVGTSTGYISTDLLNVDPLLSPLGNYGGATQTVALQAGSPAINAGDNYLAPPTDQRGISRLLPGNTVDIGAYEYP